MLGKIRIVQASRHIFGLTCSPYIAIQVVQDHAQKTAAEFPKASAAVLRDTVMDDVLTGCFKKEDLHQMYEEMDCK